MLKYVARCSDVLGPSVRQPLCLGARGQRPAQCWRVVCTCQERTPPLFFYEQRTKRISVGPHTTRTRLKLPRVNPPPRLRTRPAGGLRVVACGRVVRCGAAGRYVPLTEGKGTPTCTGVSSFDPEKDGHALYDIIHKGGGRGASDTVRGANLRAGGASLLASLVAPCCARTHARRAFSFRLSASARAWRGGRVLGLACLWVKKKRPPCVYAYPPRGRPSVGDQHLGVPYDCAAAGDPAVLQDNVS